MVSTNLRMFKTTFSRKILRPREIKQVANAESRFFVINTPGLPGQAIQTYNRHVAQRAKQDMHIKFWWQNSTAHDLQISSHPSSTVLNAHSYL